jgi:hypothetical protein
MMFQLATAACRTHHDHVGSGTLRIVLGVARLLSLLSFLVLLREAYVWSDVSMKVLRQTYTVAPRRLLHSLFALDLQYLTT